uniref:phosphatidylinositol transfer protein alpha isoform-like n=1 Tax=Semicossyphus pulcher TaxID=241346 RepID=UPI0037E96A4F
MCFGELENSQLLTARRFQVQTPVHGLDAATWETVKVEVIDIADRSIEGTKDYNPEEDPAKFKSQKTGRGPLGPDWKKELATSADCPHMCAYKLVSVKVKWTLVGSTCESLIHKTEKRLFTNFHRQLFCWMDKWIDLSMDDIRRMEEETKKELDEMRNTGEIKGMTSDEKC